LVTATQAPWEAAWKDYYQILGVPPDATAEQIRQAYRYLAYAFHPDRFPQSHEARKRAEEDFKRINEAYEVLSDPRQRGLYDQEHKRRSSGPTKGSSGGLPVITLVPAEIFITGASRAQPASFSFEVHVVGSSCDIDQLRIQADQDWVSIARLAAESLTPPNTFPLRVTLDMETARLKPGHIYKSVLHVMVG
jgi:curved DNA-binding protein CbpA